MHFITGGAYNGKRNWVKHAYHLTAMEHAWFSAYKNDASFLFDPKCEYPSIVVLEGMEKWIRQQLSVKSDPDQLQAVFQETLNNWIHWENRVADRRLIIIGTDITKGIVPAEQKDRVHRDVTGRLYQYLAGKSSRMYIIWYGISENVK
jgi:adenosyl cobinamide kinase/adenosyl cobinamide phosphate guanylyltransferase